MDEAYTPSQGSTVVVVLSPAVTVVTWAPLPQPLRRYPRQPLLLAPLAQRAGEVEIALWFHHAIYALKAKDNELRRRSKTAAQRNTIYSTPDFYQLLEPQARRKLSQT